jgi:ubiquinone/menaquinone biosynthesis C-methylase UbiE
MSPLTIIIVFFVLLIGVSLIWRYASRRRSLPCPRWLGFFLDNPLAGVEANLQITRAELKPGMNVLDAGCGTGRLTLPIARLVGSQGRVLAVDIQQKMLDTVSARLNAAGLKNFEIRKVALGEGIFQEQSAFDRAFLTTVLGEIPNQVPALREIYAALKPGGILSVSEIMLDPHYQSPARARGLAEQAGFRFDRQFGNRFKFTSHFVKPE